MTRISRKRVLGLLAGSMVLFILAETILGQAPLYEWALRAGGGDTDYGKRIGADQNGNSYVFGKPGFSARFGTTNISGADLGKAFIAKYDESGSFQWVQLLVHGDYSTFSSMVADAMGNYYLTGQYDNNRVSFPVFIAKYDSAGGLVWSQEVFGGGLSRAIALNANNNLFLTGEQNYGLYTTAAFISRHGSSGSVSWSQIVHNTGQLGDGDVRGQIITADNMDNVYVTGSFSHNADFGVTNLTGGQAFLAKYNAAGGLEWARVIAQSGSDIGLDAAGNLYVASGVLTKFDNNGGVQWTAAGANGLVVDRDGNNYTQSGNNLRKYDSNGAIQWFQSASNATVQGLALDVDGNIFGTGIFSGTTRFGATTLTSSGGSSDIFVFKRSRRVPPIITAQPQSRIVIAGSNLTFSVAATEPAPVRFEWQHDGVSINGQTNATLSISSAALADAGNYRALVSNADGSVTSLLATLTVNYSLVLNATAGGTVTRIPDQTAFSPGSIVVLTANANAGYAFLNWSGSVTGTNNPITVTVDANKTITANFGFTVLNVATQGVGSVSKIPDRPYYGLGEQVTLTATPGRWYVFTRWGDGVTANPRVITIGANDSYTAIFSPTTAVETLTFSNVSRTAPVGMAAIFVDGTFVVTNEVSRLDLAEVSMLTTFPNGSIFYTVDGSAPDFGASLFSGPFVLHRSATLRAVAYDASFLNSWEADPVQVIIEPTFVVNATTAGGGTVGVSPVGASYRSNALLTLSATPAPGWTFLHWLGHASGTSAMTSVRVMNRDLCAQALFGTTLGTTVAGNGSVVVDPAAEFYPYGTTVRLTAVPQPGSYFGAWGNAMMSTNNPLLLTVTNPNPTVSCAFGPLSGGQVALTVLVNGRGRVMTNPRGNRFTSNQSVTLTATADADQEFLAWSGDATGTTTNLTLALTQSKVVIANFTKHPRLSLGPCLGGWSEDGFQLTLTGEFGGRYRIEQSRELMNWTELASFTNTFGIWQMIDTDATNRAMRFYRAVEQP